MGFSNYDRNLGVLIGTFVFVKVNFWMTKTTWSKVKSEFNQEEYLQLIPN